MSRDSAMTLRTYRISPTGLRIELSRSEVHAAEPFELPITLQWPDCQCHRCDPGLASQPSPRL